MKRLLVLWLALISVASAQTAPDDTALGAGLELNLINHGDTQILPVSINISKYLAPGADRDLNNITIEDLEIALAKVSGADIFDDDLGGKGGLMATGSLGVLSLKRKQFIFKGERAEYNLINFVDASVGAIANIGGEFFIQLDLFLDVAGARKFENDKLFKITSDEFEEYLNSDDCVNCADENMTAGRDENVTNLTYQQLVPRYGAGIKMRYKRVKLSLYKQNYMTNYRSGLLVENDEGQFHYDKRFLDKTTIVTEVKVELAYEALKTKVVDLDVFASYAITALKSETIAHHETEVLQSAGEYEMETQTSVLPNASFLSVGERSLFRAGLRIRIN